MLRRSLSTCNEALEGESDRWQDLLFQTSDFVLVEGFIGPVVLFAEWLENERRLMRAKELVEQIGIFSLRQLFGWRKEMVHILIHQLRLERDLVWICNGVLRTIVDRESLYSQRIFSSTSFFARLRFDMGGGGRSTNTSDGFRLVSIGGVAIVLESRLAPTCRLGVDVVIELVDVSSKRLVVDTCDDSIDSASADRTI